MRSAQDSERERGIFREEKSANVYDPTRVAHTPTKWCEDSPSSLEMMCFD